MGRIRLRNWARARLAVSALVILGAESMGSRPAAQVSLARQSRQTLRVLFIGNSVTFYNNLGDIVAGIAAADPDGPMIAPTLATRGAATLKWHLENGPALKLLQAGGWDYVVLQEQTLLGGAMVNGHIVLGDPSVFSGFVRDWVGRVRAVGAKPILYMTFARRDPAAEAAKAQRQIADAYLTIGRELGVKVAPVGLAFAEARRRLRTMDLHIWDALHPTPAGSYLIASVMYSTLTGRSPVGAPAVIWGHPMVDSTDPSNDATILDPTVRVPLVDLRDATAAALQEVAWAIVSEKRE